MVKSAQVFTVPTSTSNKSPISNCVSTIVPEPQAEPAEKVNVPRTSTGEPPPSDGIFDTVTVKVLDGSTVPAKP